MLGLFPRSVERLGGDCSILLGNLLALPRRGRHGRASIDCDALDDDLMPAVDHRLPGGLSWEELESVIGLAVASRRAAGVEITIFNPALERDSSTTQALVSCLGLVTGSM